MWNFLISTPVKNKIRSRQMGKNSLLYFILISGGILFFIGWLFFLKPGNSPKEFVRSLDAVPEAFDRIFIDQVNSSVQALTDTSFIFRPSQIRTYQDDIYVSDFSDFTIYKYDLEGIETGKIETGKGEGPGEFQNLTDFDVIDGTLWAVDIRNFTVSSFSIDTGEYLSGFKVENRPIRITTLKDGLVVQWLGAEKLFSKFDFSGNEIYHFGEIIENQVQHVLSLDGALISNKLDRFTYIPSYASLIYHYQGDGELINVLKAPDGVEFPATRREGAMSFAPEFSFQRDGYMDDNDNLYVYTRLPEGFLSMSTTQERVYSTIDKYDLVAGEYISSLHIPHEYGSAVYSPHTQALYSVYQGESFIYQIQAEERF